MPVTDDRMLRAAACGDPFDQRQQIYRAQIFPARTMVLRQPREQIIHATGRIVQRRDHVGAEIGVVGVALGIARDQGQLADEVLDVVQDESEAAVEFVEALGFREGFLRPRLGEVARDLAPGDAQQVEILPVERAVDRRAREQDRPLQAAEMRQRQQHPAFGIEHPRRHARRLGRVGGVAAHRVEFDDASAARERGDQRGGRAGARPVPVPPRADAEARPFRHQQQPGGRIGQVGDRLDDTLVERGRTIGLAERVCEARPFDAVVIAVAEEVLGDLDLRPRLDPGRRQDRQARRGRSEHEGGLPPAAHSRR